MAGFLESVKQFFKVPPPVDRNETTQEIKRDKTVLTTEEIEEAGRRPVGMQGFGYDRIDGMDNSYLNREEKEKRDLEASRKRIAGIK